MPLQTDDHSRKAWHILGMLLTGLNAGKVSNNQPFWVGVQVAFKSKDECHDKPHFVDDEVLSDLHHINFQKIVPHDWKKLCVIWKNLNVEYKAALNHYSMLGTHSSKLYEFVMAVMTCTA